jgi:signal transduction histidine kinase
MPPGRPLRAFEQQLIEDVAAQAGVAFRNALLEAELAGQVAQSEHQSAELAASRQRLLDVEDDARERLAGAIRRKVVPHLTAVETELAARPATDHNGVRRVETLIGETQQALDELRTVCRGMFPALLDRRGLVAALSAQLDLTHPLAVLTVDDTADRRLNRAVEAAGYVFCTEVAPTHRRSQINLRVENEALLTTITSGPGWAREIDEMTELGSILPWQYCRDRLSALDGVLTVRQDELGMTVSALVPLTPSTG